MKQVEAYSESEQFLDWVETQIGDCELHQELHDFHEYLRSNDISSGTILGYLRQMYRDLDEDGELKATADESWSAVKKFREYRDSIEKTTDEVEDE